MGGRWPGSSCRRTNSYLWDRESCTHPGQGPLTPHHRLQRLEPCLDKACPQKCTQMGPVPWNCIQMWLWHPWRTCSASRPPEHLIPLSTLFPSAFCPPQHFPPSYMVHLKRDPRPLLGTPSTSHLFQGETGPAFTFQLPAVVRNVRNHLLFINLKRKRKKGHIIPFVTNFKCTLLTGTLFLALELLQRAVC